MKKNYLLSLLISIVFLNGCTTLKNMKALYLDTDENASIVIITYKTIWSFEVKNPEARVYLTNIETKEEKSFLLYNSRLQESVHTQRTLATNLKAGIYEFSRWDYDACKKMERSKYFLDTLCKESYHLKGKNRKLENARFEIKEGETIYLGHITFDSENASLSLTGFSDKSLENWKFENREVKNISNSIKMKNWKFEMTGYKGILEWDW